LAVRITEHRDDRQHPESVLALDQHRYGAVYIPDSAEPIAGETNGIAIDATSDGGTVAVKDTTTPGNDVTLAASPLTRARERGRHEAPEQV
jgi:hypothetical protein